MNLYDLNKQLVGQLPIKENLDSEKEMINNHWKDNYTSRLMLLCNDINYYTIFEHVPCGPEFNNIADAVIECAQDIGQIICVDIVDAGNIEIWVRTPEENNLCMYLFDCKRLCVSFGG